MTTATPGILEPMDALTVGQLAERYGVTVRTLHHYDHVGLLTPSGRGRNGYRLYTSADQSRLGHIVLYRRLGFALQEIGGIIDAIEADPSAALPYLQGRRQAVAATIYEHEQLMTALDAAMEAAMKNQPATAQDIHDVFGHHVPFAEEGYSAEAEQRWGDSPQWAQSQTRTGSYSKADWQRIKDEGEAANTQLVEVFRSGADATSEAAMDAAEAQRELINRSFYDASHETHCHLADMYVCDPRFTAYYEALAEGLAPYYRDAIYANARRHNS